MPDLQNELSAHFASREAAANEQRRIATEEHKRLEALRIHVAEKMRTSILPEIMKVRDFLLGRNFPAFEKMVPDVGGGIHATVVGLYCSNQIEDYTGGVEGMPYYAVYVLDNQQVEFKTKCSRREGEKSVKVAIDDLTAEDAARRLMEFVKAAYPVQQ